MEWLVQNFASDHAVISEMEGSETLLSFTFRKLNLMVLINHPCKRIPSKCSFFTAQLRVQYSWNVGDLIVFWNLSLGSQNKCLVGNLWIWITVLWKYIYIWFIKWNIFWISIKWLDLQMYEILAFKYSFVLFFPRVVSLCMCVHSFWVIPHDPNSVTGLAEIRT